ncbi:Os12g0299050 [Oryza sativa Japonica Group]|uniref:Os12g0299050 protein n=1 Tax=Oryza sativa subsp. japonica TaxID=39947 RepID=A0A0P0Y9F3_ORYSJ|nr:Os12g0299050 [Oryza sativa Japonica Group]
MADVQFNLARFTPLGLHLQEVGLFAVRSPLVRDTLVEAFGFQYSKFHTVHFRHHGRGSNWRAAHTNRRGWVMFLGYPLDFRNQHYINKEVSLFGRLVDWQERDPIPGSVMLRAVFDDIDAVPRVFLLKELPLRGGLGQSWTFGVFVLNTEFADIHLGDEDLPPLMVHLQEPTQQHNDHMDMQPDAPPQHDQPWGNWDQQGENNPENTGNSGISAGPNQNLAMSILENEASPVFFVLDSVQGKIQEVVLRNQGPPTVLLVHAPFISLVLPRRNVAFDSLPLVYHSSQLPLVVVQPLGHDEDMDHDMGSPLGHDEIFDVQPLAISEPLDQAQPKSPPRIGPVPLLLEPPRASVKKRDGKTVMFDPDRRQSSRLRSSSQELTQPDPRMGIGKPRGKSAKKLKELFFIGF